MSDDQRPFFFYGSLMDDRVLRRVLGNLGATTTINRRVESAVLHGFRRFRVLNAMYPGIERTSPSKDTVHGVLVWIDAEWYQRALERLDQFEGIDEGLYRRIHAPVTFGDNDREASVDAFVYEWVGAESLKTTIPWNFEQFQANIHRFLSVEEFDTAPIDDHSP